jgi:hypothetical protein
MVSLYAFDDGRVGMASVFLKVILKKECYEGKRGLENLPPSWVGPNAETERSPPGLFESELQAKAGKRIDQTIIIQKPR